LASNPGPTNIDTKGANKMKLESTFLQIPTTSGTDIEDLSTEVEHFVQTSGIQQGWVLIFVPGSTAALTTIEYESGALSDLRRAIETLAPEDGEYEHNLRWGDGNGYSHVRAALMGPSLTVPIAAGKPVTGTWQQIVLCDFDNRPRTRKIHLQACGT
jgi:secondary thiamine-phosphate synthase enzyme